MTIQAGTRLGPYEILSELGAGGMGHVYRARDARLNREVAIKVLPDVFVNDAERVARFEREARLISQLNHPNICALYDICDAPQPQSIIAHLNRVQFLVLELVEGPTLADLIAGARAGPRALSIEAALPIARQIADALEAAHELGIVHRDLKPANIKVRADGVVKVLDFGLAKAVEPASALHASAGQALSQLPTMTSPAMLSGVGMILGTAAYMSPEQARGSDVDKRADLWAFGVVLWEMLSGKRLFEGATVSDTLAAVLKTQPDWAELPAQTPEPIRRLLRRCLEKDRKRRLESAADARLELEDAVAAPTGDGRVEHGSATATLGGRALPWVAAVVACVFAIVFAMRGPVGTSSTPTPSMRLTADLGVDASLGGPLTPNGGGLALSPDGSLLVFVGQKEGGPTEQLFLRPLDQLGATPLVGTDGAGYPFFSPDGGWVAFFANGKLKKVGLAGGVVLTLCDAQTPRGGSWGEDGEIVFAAISRGGLMRVSSSGGTPVPLTTLGSSEITHRWPQALPGGKAVLYTASSSTNFAMANLVVQPLPTGLPVVVQPGGSNGRYLPSGHLVYVSGSTLFTVPFDLSRLTATGPQVPLLDGVAASTTSGSAELAVSSTGTLVYQPRETATGSTPIHWMDSSGKTTLLRATPARWSNPQFAPDGERVALDINDGKQTDVWVYEWIRDTLARLTFDAGEDISAVWTPDGRRVAFASQRADKATFNLYWQRADGSGDAQRLTEAKTHQFPASWHPSGRFLAFWQNNQQTGSDLMVLPVDGDEATGRKVGNPTVFLSTPYNEEGPIFSPDGRWLAYQSDESGRFEVYVRPFPGPGGKWQISTDGGIYPMWSRKRNQLFYGSGDGHVMAVQYAANGDSLRPEKPRAWGEGRFTRRGGVSRFFNLHPDGERVALALASQAIESRQDKLVFVSNIFDELHRVAP